MAVAGDPGAPLHFIFSVLIATFTWRTRVITDELSVQLPQVAAKAQARSEPVDVVTRVTCESPPGHHCPPESGCLSAWLGGLLIGAVVGAVFTGIVVTICRCCQFGRRTTGWAAEEPRERLVTVPQPTLTDRVWLTSAPERTAPEPRSPDSLGVFTPKSRRS